MFQCRTKIFREYHNCDKSADESFNEWIKDHPNIHISNFEFKVDKYAYAYICILYEEEV